MELCGVSHVVVLDTLVLILIIRRCSPTWALNFRPLTSEATVAELCGISHVVVLVGLVGLIMRKRVQGSGVRVCGVLPLSKTVCLVSVP